MERPTLELLRRFIGEHLAKIAPIMPEGSALTLIAITPEGSVLFVGDSSPGEVCEALESLESLEPATPSPDDLTYH